MTFLCGVLIVVVVLLLIALGVTLYSMIVEKDLDKPAGEDIYNQAPRRSYRLQ